EDREVAGVALARQRRDLRGEEVVEQLGEVRVRREGDGVRGHNRRIPRGWADSCRAVSRTRILSSRAGSPVAALTQKLIGGRAHPEAQASSVTLNLRTG